MNNSEENKLAQNKLPFWRRLLIYQSERFPLLGHGVLITVFTFSAVSYSRICREVEGFIAIKDFAIGVFATITLFLLVRIFDEFKDKEDDEKFRSYLPVPRGLVTLRELAILAWVVAIIQITVIAVFQTRMLWLYLLVFAYLLLMRVEFFVPHWLKKRQIIYVLSHMFIIPLIDLYSSGLDWLLGNGEPHWGLAWFFAVSYMNGVVLEIGRKIRAPSNEEKGVVSYTSLFGTKGGVWAYLLVLFITYCLSIGASLYANFNNNAIIIFTVFFIVLSLPSFSFLRNPSEKKSKWIEYSSAIWTILMYLGLGAIPMFNNLIN